MSHRERSAALALCSVFLWDEQSHLFCGFLEANCYRSQVSNGGVGRSGCLAGEDTRGSYWVEGTLGNVATSAVIMLPWQRIVWQTQDVALLSLLSCILHTLTPFIHLKSYHIDRYRFKALVQTVRGWNSLEPKMPCAYLCAYCHLMGNDILKCYAWH
jgi:hypothetical protein